MNFFIKIMLLLVATSGILAKYAFRASRPTPAATLPVHGFLAVGLFLGQKSKISQEQNVKEFQFYIRLPNFSFLESIIKKVPWGSRSP